MDWLLEIVILNERNMALRQNKYLTVHPVTGGRFPRARLEPPRRKLLRGLESRAVPAGVAACNGIC